MADLEEINGNSSLDVLVFQILALSVLNIVVQSFSYVQDTKRR